MELPERFQKFRMCLAEKVAGKRHSVALQEALPAANLPDDLAKADHDALSASVDAWMRWAIYAQSDDPGFIQQTLD
eukprot:gene23403-5692_t